MLHRLVLVASLLLLLLGHGALCVPHESPDGLLKEYTDGVHSLLHVAQDIQYQEASEEYAKAADAEVTEEAEEYDFIVVGAGTAGSVLAARLSEVPEWQVLVLEAGGAENKVGQVPALATAMQHTDYNWGYALEPQEHACLGMVGARCAAVQGKALGGTSAIGNMLYARGHPLDFDRWADDKQLQSWCYDHVLPWFKKSEDASLKQFDNKYHSQGGPLDVQEAPYTGPLRDTFLQAAKDLGSPLIDYNGKQLLGFGPVQATTLHGKRRSTAEAFLKPASHRRNLHVVPGAYVTRVLIGEHTLEATGVKYVTRHDGKPHVARARKEVLLAAGVYNSPKLLKLSGVGPRAELERHGIAVRVHRPGVGENLIDQLTYIGLNFAVNATTNGEDVKEQQPAAATAAAAAALKQWVNEGTGPYASPQHLEALGYVKTAASKEQKDVPDVRLAFHSLPEGAGEDEGHVFQLTNRLTDEMYAGQFKAALLGHRQHVYSVRPTLLHPRSKRGTVSLRSANPFHWPQVHVHHLTDADDHDIETLLHGVRHALALGTHAAFQAHGAHPLETATPGCGAHKHGTDDYWRCSIRHLVLVSPQGGTCKMGATATDDDDDHHHMAVVDGELRVHGVTRLRVADASVVPLSLSGDALATNILIGEKAADLVKEAWK